MHLLPEIFRIHSTTKLTQPEQQRQSSCVNHYLTIYGKSTIQVPQCGPVSTAESERHRGKVVRAVPSDLVVNGQRARRVQHAEVVTQQITRYHGLSNDNNTLSASATVSWLSLQYQCSGLPGKARFPLPELMGDRFPLPVNSGRVDGRELTGRQHGPSIQLVETRARQHCPS